MQEMVFCQSCGMPLTGNDVKGTNGNESLSEDYCMHCFVEGKFTEDITMDEMIEQNLKYIDEWNRENNTNYTVDEAREELKKFMPHLKRWKTVEKDTF